jgi:hypothetical protein
VTVEHSALPPESARLIDAYAEALRNYAEFALRIGTEYDSLDDVAEDPRVEDAAERLAVLGAELSDAFEAELGIHAPVAVGYEPADELADEGEADEGEAEAPEALLTLSFELAGGTAEHLMALPEWLYERGDDLAKDIGARGVEVLDQYVSLEVTDDEVDD